MQRTTRKDLDQLAAELNRLTEGGYHIGHAYGQPRLEQATPEGGCRDISPRLPSGELFRWIKAYLCGFYLGRTQGERQAAERMKEDGFLLTSPTEER
jgi:hypothetical protein